MRVHAPRGHHNPHLTDTIRQLRRRLEPNRRFSFQIGRRIGESHAGNAEAAGALMREHMDIQRRNFGRVLPV